MFYVMNHPKPEEWVPYLYGGLTPDTRRQLKTHLDNCADCRGELQRWKRSIHRLDAWKLPRAGNPLQLLAPALKWAAAAAIVLGVGFGLGRFTGTEAMAARVRARVEPQLRQALQQQMAQLVRAEVERISPAALKQPGNQTEKLLADYIAVNDARAEQLQQFCLNLEHKVDTVAVNTAREFVELATYHPPSANHPPQ
jgi:anti-sigma factor RsiW